MGISKQVLDENNHQTSIIVNDQNKAKVVSPFK